MKHGVLHSAVRNTAAFPTIRKYRHSYGNSAVTCGWIMRIAPAWQHIIHQASVTLLSI